MPDSREHGLRAGFQRRERLFDRKASRFDIFFARTSRNFDRAPDGDRKMTARLRDLMPIPAVDSPIRRRLDVERHDGIAGGARQPCGAGLGHTRRTSRAIHGEGCGVPVRHLSPQLSKRSRTTTRRGSSSRVIAEPAHQPRDPLPVEILACHRDNAAIAEVQRRRQNPAVPKSQNWLTPLVLDALKMIGTSLNPAVGSTERLDDRHTYGGDRSNLELAPCGKLHRPSYWGPSPPSGGTQSMIWYGSMMSHVLQWTQFDALMCSFLVPSPASTIS